MIPIRSPWGAACALLLAAVSGGCGHSVKPTERYSSAASLPEALSVIATQEEGAVVLSWSITGDAYRYVDGWNVYRKDVMDGPGVRLNDAPVPDVVYRDATVAEGGEYYYSVRSVSPAGVEGLPSHDLVLRYDRVPPPAPSGLTAVPAANAVSLGWDPSRAPDLASYRLYRDGALLAGALAATAYTDMPVAPGVPRRYEVTAVDRNGNESIPSEAVEAEALGAADATPPSAPPALAATPVASGIALAWSAPPDPDLLGFLLYRKAAGEASFARLPGAGAVAGTEYLDAAVSGDAEYVYVVTAVDSSGNESGPSPEASAAWVSRTVDTGGATLGSVYPWCGVVSNSGRMQFLVPAGDITRSGRVDTLGLWLQSGVAIYHGVTITLSHTPATTLGATFTENRAAAGAPVTVFGPTTLDLSAGGPARVLPLPLSTPFDYDGAGSVLVEISWSGDDNRTVVFSFRSSPGANRRLWTQPDGATARLEPYQQFVRFVFR
ncbi:MAG TPA: hypothetical protein VFT32_13430 [Candidatus Eisenbacteria bacterium]|nr:hypothetical protein [Candidatus Eisenbacteria bacterium]